MVDFPPRPGMAGDRRFRGGNHPGELFPNVEKARTAPEELFFPKVMGTTLFIDFSFRLEDCLSWYVLL